MAQLQWPIKRGQKKKPMSEGLEQQTKIEAGFTEIKGTHFLMSRLDFTEEFFSAIIGVLETERDSLLNKKERSASDDKRLDLLKTQLVNFNAYKVLKKASIAWGIAKEDNDMSERYSALEQVFARNWDNPHHQKMLMASIGYLADISFEAKHVDPAPTLLVQTPTSGPRISLASEPKNEE